MRQPCEDTLKLERCYSLALVFFPAGNVIHLDLCSFVFLLPGVATALNVIVIDTGCQNNLETDHWRLPRFQNFGTKILETNNSNCNRPGSGEDIPKGHLPILLAISYFNNGRQVIRKSPEISCSKEEKGGNPVPARGGVGAYLLEQDLPLS